MRIHRWIVDPGEFFEARCLDCGLVVLDAPVFDHEVYPMECDHTSAHAHRMTVGPHGAECVDCGLSIAHTWTTIGTENT